MNKVVAVKATPVLFITPFQICSIACLLLNGLKKRQVQTSEAGVVPTNELIFTLEFCCEFVIKILYISCMKYKHLKQSKPISRYN